jgi:hypothetical protein
MHDGLGIEYVQDLLGLEAGWLFIVKPLDDARVFFVFAEIDLNAATGDKTRREAGRNFPGIVLWKGQRNDDLGGL